MARQVSFQDQSFVSSNYYRRKFIVPRQKGVLRPVNIAVTQKSSHSLTSDTFHRANYYNVLLSPLLHKYPNMKTKTSFLNGVEVKQVQFQDKQTTGVECRHLSLINPKNQNKIQRWVKKKLVDVSHTCIEISSFIYGSYCRNQR